MSHDTRTSHDTHARHMTHTSHDTIRYVTQCCAVLSCGVTFCHCVVLPCRRVTGDVRRSLRLAYLSNQRHSRQPTGANSGVLWCGVVCCVVAWCGVVWCGVTWCGVVWCHVVWCGVMCCGVLCCGVLCCGVVCCAVLCCAVLCCGCMPLCVDACVRVCFTGATYYRCARHLRV